MVRNKFIYIYIYIYINTISFCICWNIYTHVQARLVSNTYAFAHTGTSATRAALQDRRHGKSGLKYFLAAFCQTLCSLLYSSRFMKSLLREFKSSLSPSFSLFPLIILLFIYTPLSLSITSSLQDVLMKSWQAVSIEQLLPPRAHVAITFTSYAICKAMLPCWAVWGRQRPLLSWPCLSACSLLPALLRLPPQLVIHAAFLHGSAQVCCPRPLPLRIPHPHPPW